MNMNTGTRQSRESCGPPVYENWLAAREERPLWGIEEHELYTHAHITGEITDGYGPYQFLNLVPLPVKEMTILGRLLFFDLASTRKIHSTVT